MKSPQISDAAARVMSTALSRGLPVRPLAAFLDWIQAHGLEADWDGHAAPAGPPPALAEKNTPDTGAIIIKMDRKGNPLSDLTTGDDLGPGKRVTIRPGDLTRAPGGPGPTDVRMLRVPVAATWARGGTGPEESGEIVGRVMAPDAVVWLVQRNRDGMYDQVPDEWVCKDCRREAMERWELDHGDRSEAVREQNKAGAVVPA